MKERKRSFFRRRSTALIAALIVLVSVMLVFGPILSAVASGLSSVATAIGSLAGDPLGRLLLFNLLVAIGLWVSWRRAPEQFRSLFRPRPSADLGALCRAMVHGDDRSARRMLESIGRVEEGTPTHDFVRAAGRFLESRRRNPAPADARTRASLLAPFQAGMSEAQMEEQVVRRAHPLALVPAAEWAREHGHDDLAVAIAHAALLRLSGDPESVSRLARVLQRDDPPRAVPRSYLADAVRQDLSQHWPIVP